MQKQGQKYRFNDIRHNIISISQLPFNNSITQILLFILFQPILDRVVVQFREYFATLFNKKLNSKQSFRTGFTMQSLKYQTCKITVLGLLVKSASPHHSSIWDNILTIKGGAQQHTMRKLKLKECSSLTFYIEVQKDLILLFSLSKDDEESDYAQGFLKAQVLGKRAGLSCMVKATSQKLDILQIKLQISFDDERQGFNMGNYEQSLEQSKTQEWQHKPSGLHPRISGKATRQHHYTYLLHCSPHHKKYSLKNQIKSLQNFTISNIKLQLNEAIIVQSFKFFDAMQMECIGQVLCNSDGDSVEELKNCDIKVPVSIDQLLVQIKDKNGVIFKGRVTFDIYGLEVGKNTSFQLVDSLGDYKGKIIINYGIKNNKQTWTQQKLSLVKQPATKSIYEPDSPSIAHYLNTETPTKKLENKKISPFKLPNNLSNRLQLVSMTVNKKIQPFRQYSLQIPRINTVNREVSPFFDQTYSYSNINSNNNNNKSKNNRNSQLIARQAKLINYNKISQFIDFQKYREIYADKKYQESQFDRFNYIDYKQPQPRQHRQYQQYGQHPRYRTLQSEMARTPHKPHKPHIIRINSVSFHFYKDFVIKYGINIEKDSTIGKFIEVYSTSSRVHRSDVIFASPNLCWKLRNCQLKMQTNHKLHIEMCEDIQKSCLANNSIYFQELQISLQRHNMYKGYLISNINRDRVGQIVINFELFPAIGRKQKQLRVRDQAYKVLNLQQINQRLRQGLSPSTRQNNKRDQADRQYREGLEKRYSLQKIEEYPRRQKKSMLARRR